MNALEFQGKMRAIRLFASVLLISIYIAVTFHLAKGYVDYEKLFQQIVRIIITIVLMYFIMKGKDWARITFSILLSLGLIFAIFTLITSFSNTALLISLIAPILIYGLTLYHLNFSISFKAYFNSIY